MPRVHTGKGAIIGAGVVVTKDILSQSIAVVSPTKVLKVFDKKLDNSLFINKLTGKNWIKKYTVSIIVLEDA